jgi:hypothetical protein
VPQGVERQAPGLLGRGVAQPPGGEGVEELVDRDGDDEAGDADN